MLRLAQFYLVTSNGLQIEQDTATVQFSRGLASLQYWLLRRLGKVSFPDFDQTVISQFEISFIRRWFNPLMFPVHTRMMNVRWPDGKIFRLTILL